MFQIDIPKFFVPNPSLIFSGQQTRCVMFAKIYQINLVQIDVSSGSDKWLFIFCLDYAFVFVEGHNTTIVAKLTYA